MSDHESVLAPRLERLLRDVGPVLNRFGLVLVGGTALALQLNHRRSLDLDFFGEDEFDPDEMSCDLETELEDRHSIQVVGKGRNTLNLLIDGIKVDILRHRYPRARAPIDWNGVKIAPAEEVAAMKLNAITNRGAKKDFFDVYFLLQRFPLSQLLEWHGRKYRNHDPFFVIQSLSYFEDAETQPDPELKEEVSWEAVKSTITEAVKHLGQK